MFLDKKGSLLFVVFLLILFAFIGAIVVSLLSVSSISSSEDFVSKKAFYLAESGKEIAIEKCASENVCADGDYTMENGKISVRFLSHKNINLNNGTSAELYTATSEGIIGDIRKKIEFKFWK